MKNSDKAKSYFEQGFSCSQSVLSTFSEQNGLDKITALRLAESFGGGIGHMGNICGAVTGALMVIGLRHGRVDADDSKSKEDTDKFVKEFLTKFRQKNGTIICKELLGYDIGTEEGERKIREQNLFHTKCPNYIEDAVKILEEII